METINSVKRSNVPESERLDITEKLFGMHWPLKLEPVIYGITAHMAEDYQGGYWEFYTLDNGGFYMAPDTDRTFAVSSMNQWQGQLSADALGIVVCVTAYSHLSFGGPESFARTCANHYHMLREFMYDHPEVSNVLSAID
ncbi:antirestriction protein [Halieaceae bacterium IMCC14734]|uniref:Antirestriction protein n=1 Tax=Candidatus Litorirhabdus singularis TaxID=2518993 RepID=A0ABT3TPS4_9GAMM|nr:antirestriction protein [Candidatus Litorirhabdus singularis]MCX2983399.1 antirestriction protein [Candidatus Litorirhabdus singularis]